MKEIQNLWARITLLKRLETKLQDSVSNSRKIQIKQFGAHYIGPKENDADCLVQNK